MRERVRGVQTLISRERECKGGQPLVPGPSPCVLSFTQDDMNGRRNTEISYETPQIHRFILELFPLCHDVRDTSLSRFSAVAIKLYTLSQRRPCPQAPRTATAASRARPYLLELGARLHPKSRPRSLTYKPGLLPVLTDARYSTQAVSRVPHYTTHYTTPMQSPCSTSNPSRRTRFLDPGVYAW